MGHREATSSAGVTSLWGFFLSVPGKTAKDKGRGYSLTLFSWMAGAVMKQRHPTLYVVRKASMAAFCAAVPSPDANTARRDGQQAAVLHHTLRPDTRPAGQRIQDSGGLLSLSTGTRCYPLWHGF